MRHHKVRGTAGKGSEGVGYSLRPRLGFKHTAEHGQSLDIPESAVVSQPGGKNERKSQEKRYRKDNCHSCGGLLTGVEFCLTKPLGTRAFYTFGSLHVESG